MPDRNKPTHEQIRQRAYELFLERGGEHGREAEDWFAAEQEFSEFGSRDLPPGLEALLEQSLQRQNDRDGRNEGTKLKKKYATSGGSSSS